MESRLTGTGLDRLVEIIETDAGINRRASASDVLEGAEAAGALNAMLLNGIRELGLANDGTIDASDLRALGDWARADERHQTFLDLYGTNRNGIETGFQLVENEDSDARLFGQDAVDEVADAIYSFGFGDRDGRLLDVDGNPYRSVILTAGWLDDLLTTADMEALSNPNGSLVVEGSTGTGLDRIVDIIQTDPGLIRNVSRTDIAEGARAADALNQMYLDGMDALGLANDGTIDKSDVVAIGEWVHFDAGRFADFRDLHEDWHLVLNKGADLAEIDGVTDGVHPHIGHVVNHGFRGIYQIGFGAEDGILLDDNGEPDVGARVPASWFDQLLTDTEKKDLGNPEGSLVVESTTGTGLDQLVDIIRTDPGLIRNVSRSDIAEAAEAADAMNSIIVQAIKDLGAARDGRINDVDVEKINGYIRSDDALHDEFLMLYGRVENDGETGFQLVQGNGGSEKLSGKWAVNNVADGVYSVGFAIETNKFLDGDGDPSYSVVRVAEWIDDLYFA
jgi:hypothetical protein